MKRSATVGPLLKEGSQQCMSVHKGYMRCCDARERWKHKWHVGANPMTVRCRAGLLPDQDCILLPIRESSPQASIIDVLKLHCGCRRIGDSPTEMCSQDLRGRREVHILHHHRCCICHGSYRCSCCSSWQGSCAAQHSLLLFAQFSHLPLHVLKLLLHGSNATAVSSP